MNIIIIIHAIQSFLLSMLLLTPRFRSKPNNILMIIMMGCVMYFIIHGLDINGIVTRWQHAYLQILIVLPPPLILCYWYTYIYGKYPTRSYFIKHLIVPVVALVGVVIANMTGTPVEIVKTILGELAFLMHLVYPFFMLNVLQDFYKIERNRIAETLSYNSEKVSILKIFGFMMLFHSTIFLMQYNLPFLIPEMHNSVLFIYAQVIFLVLLQYLLTWIIIRMPVVIHFSDDKVGLAAFRKHVKSGMSYENAYDTAQKLNRFMDREKPFLNPLYAVNDLSRDMGMDYLKVTETLNGLIGQSFNDYINNYRVEEVKRLFRDPEYSDESNLNIGFAAGFNSKAAFYAAFKKFTGITPTQCRKECCE